MSEEYIFWSPQVVASKLDISPATLRRWADEFSDFLSQSADSGHGRSHRRYTDGDLATLIAIKELMNNGMTYAHARQQLATKTTNFSEPPAEALNNDGVDNSSTDKLEEMLNLVIDNEEPEEEQDRALVAADRNISAAVAFLTNTLTTLSDTQKSILNSQAANRELLGVLIQDNFNLKEENNRLRERILEIERSVAQNRQEDEWLREAQRQELEAKIMSAQQIASEAVTVAQSVEAPEIKAVKGKSGCLGSLLGASDIQVFTVPRRRSRDSQAVRQPRASSARPASTPHPSPAQPPPAAHPKPTAPPE